MTPVKASSFGHVLGGPLGSMRRYVPVVLPLTMLFGALTVVTLLARVAAATYRRGLTLAPGALLVGLVARPSVAVVGQPLWDDALAQTAQVARLFPDQAVVLVSPDLAGTHIPTSASQKPQQTRGFVPHPKTFGRPQTTRSSVRSLRHKLAAWLDGTPQTGASVPDGPRRGSPANPFPWSGCGPHRVGQSSCRVARLRPRVGIPRIPEDPGKISGSKLLIAFIGGACRL